MSSGLLQAVCPALCHQQKHCHLCAEVCVLVTHKDLAFDPEKLNTQ